MSNFTRNGFCSLKFTHICIICFFRCTLYIFNYSWFCLDQIQEYSLPYFLCHGSPPLSFGHADPPRSSKYWPCLDAAIPFQGFPTHLTCTFYMYILQVHLTCTSYMYILHLQYNLCFEFKIWVSDISKWKKFDYFLWLARLRLGISRVKITIFDQLMPLPITEIR